MKSVFLLVAVTICSVVSGPANGAEIQPFRTATENDLIYYFYNHQHPEGVQIHSQDLTGKHVLGSAFDSNLNTVVLIHGWKDDFNANFNSEIRSALLQLHKVNVIKVDWSAIAQLNYVSARSAVPSLGSHIAVFMQKLHIYYGYSFDKVTMMGFSLGAHIAGCAGDDLDGEVAQIVGLDPAGPAFANTDADALKPTSAKYVTGIHTNGGLLGLNQPIGHSDFFVNGGSSQAGCIELTGTCSHNRAWAYMAESILKNNFVAKNCNSYKEYTSNTCSGPEVLMGGFPINKSAFGTFYLTTNRKTPYGRG